LPEAAFSLFLELAHYLGAPIAPEKTSGRLTVISFARIEFDSVKFEARLPSDKLVKYTQQISDFLNRKKVTLRELQSLNRSIEFCLLYSCTG